MRLAERAEKRRLVHHGPVGEIADVRVIRGAGVELLGHVVPGQLLEGACFQADPLDELVNAWEALGPYLVKHIIGKGAAVVGRRDGDERVDSNVPRLEMGDHISGIQPAHAVGDNVDMLSPRILGYMSCQLLSSLFDAARL